MILKCIIGSGECSITVIIQKNDMVHAITDLFADHTLGIPISNIQEKTRALETSKFSFTELLVEVSEKYLSFLKQNKKKYHLENIYYYNN